MIVVDAGAWVTSLVDRDVAGLEARRILAGDDDWAAPDHARLEVLRTLWKYERNRLLRTEDLDALVAEVASTPVRSSPVDRQTLHEVWSMRQTVSTYDAPYVVLARALGVPLITRDVRLGRAARALGVLAIVPGEDAT